MTPHGWALVRYPPGLRDIVSFGIPHERCGRCGGWRVSPDAAGELARKARILHPEPDPDCDMVMAARVMES